MVSNVLEFSKDVGFDKGEEESVAFQKKIPFQ